MSRTVKRYVHAGKYVAEIEVQSIPDDDGWGPYFSIEDALKLQRIEPAMKAGDLKSAAKDAQIFEMKPIAAE